MQARRSLRVVLLLSLLAIALWSRASSEPVPSVARVLAQSVRTGPHERTELGGPVQAVAAGRGHAYLIVDEVLVAVDATDPEAPRVS